MSRLFLGSHAALDFLNTAYGPANARVEAIGDGNALLDWMVEAGLLENEARAELSNRWAAATLDQTAAEARAFREWARGWLTRWRTDSAADFTAELRTLNATLADASYYRQIENKTLVDRVKLEGRSALLGLVAGQIADLIVEEDSSLVRTCSGTGCTLWFLDRTKAHRRVYCSAAVCGNRAKVAAFRERARRN